jgi:hypothetical protein
MVILRVIKSLADLNKIASRHVELSRLYKAVEHRLSILEVNEQLTALEKQDRISLVAKDNPRDITEDDKRYGFPNCVGTMRHLVYAIEY